MLLGLLLACGGSHQPDNRAADPAARLAGDTLRRGLAGEPASLDPASAADNFSFQVLHDVYEGLAVESATGDVQPGVAASWTVDASGTEYTFQLRPDARWSNGKPVRAQEFVAAWRRVVDPKQGSAVSDELRVVDNAAAIIAGHLAPDRLGVSAPGDTVLVVKLARPVPYFPQLLTHTATFPVYSDGSARSHSPDSWVSNGPYVLGRWLPGTQLDLHKNPRYWDQQNVHIERVSFLINSDQNAQLAQYRAGQIDMTDIVPANALPWIRSEHPGELVVAPFLATTYLGLNLSQGSVLANAGLRQALAMAIDRKRIAALQGFGQPGAYGFVPPGVWNYAPQSWDWAPMPDEQRVAEARRLYALAGFSRTKPLHLRLLFNANVSIKQTAIAVAAMWQEVLGVETALNEEEYRVFLQSRRDKSRWDVARLGWTADFNDASNFLDSFRSGSSNNDPGYSNAAFDGLLERAETATELSLRRDELQQAEMLLLNDYPIIPLYFFVSKRLVKPYVLGVKPNPLDRVVSKSLSLVAH
jgi:oligopeptide transport system substrate-binding protein